METSTSAIAVRYDNFRGFRKTSRNVPLLPFAVDKESVDLLLLGIGPDQWTWDPSTGEVTSGSDGMREINLMPTKQKNSSGNRGHLNIGSNGGKTNTLREQIREGISSDDFDYHDGSLELDSDGQLLLGGRPDVIVTLESELVQILGEPRIVPVFTQVSVSGSNTVYTIEMFLGVRIVDVKLKGKNKRIIVQLADVNAVGGIPSSGEITSYHLASPPVLVQ